MKKNNKFINKIVLLYKNMSSDEGALFVYAFAYSLIVSIAPFLVIVVMMGTNLFATEDIVSFLVRYIPQDLLNPFVDYLNANHVAHWGIISGLIVASIWLASKSVYSFLILSSSNDDLNIGHAILRILAVIYFVVIIVELIGFTIVINLLPYFRQFASLLAVFGFFLIFYRMIAFKYTRFKDLAVGSLIASVAMLILGKLFFWYINTFTNYETIYGPLSSLMILFISGLLISWICYFGYCVNLTLRDTDLKVPEKNYIFKRFNRGEDDKDETN